MDTSGNDPSLTVALIGALALGVLVLYTQPIVSVADGSGTLALFYADIERATTAAGDGWVRSLTIIGLVGGNVLNAFSDLRV